MQTTRLLKGFKMHYRTSVILNLGGQKLWEFENRFDDLVELIENTFYQQVLKLGANDAPAQRLQNAL